MSGISHIAENDPVLTAQAKGKGKPAPEAKDMIAAKKVASEFESLFVGMMLKTMRETVGKDSLTNGGHGEDIYRSLLDQEYAKAISEGHDLGIRDLLEKELVKAVMQNAPAAGTNSIDTSDNS